MEQGSTGCTYNFFKLTTAEGSPSTSTYKSQRVNLPSRRLTMPLNSLNRESAPTPAKTSTTAKESELIEEICDNLPGGNLNRSNLRRSARISEKKKVKLCSLVRNSSGSKSVFQEINEKYIKLEGTTFPLTQFLGAPQNDRRPVNHNFCRKLSQRAFSSPNAVLLTLKRKMEENFQIINSRLSGQTPKKTPLQMTRVFQSTEDKEKECITFEYFKPSEWVYSTPPRTKPPPLPKLESRIQPALLIKRENKTVVYELEGFNQFKRQKVCHEASPMEAEAGVRSLEKMCSGRFLFSDYQMSQYEENAKQPTKNLFSLNDCFIDGN